MNEKTVKIIDAVCIALFIFMMVFLFVLPEKEQDLLMPVFIVINPFRSGAWIMGAGLLAACIGGRGRTGLILGMIMLVCYLITAFVSLFGLITLTKETELLWYLHPLLLIPAGTAAFRNIRKGRRTSG